MRARANRARLAALLLGTVVAFSAPRARAGEADDIERLQNEADRIHRDIEKIYAQINEMQRKDAEKYEKEGLSFFLDYTHHLRTKTLDAGWRVPMIRYRFIDVPDPVDGPQLGGSWSANGPADPVRRIWAVVHRYGHEVAGTKPYRPASSKIGDGDKETLHSKPMEVLRALYRSYRSTLVPPPAPPTAAKPGVPAPEVADPETLQALGDAKACKEPGGRSMGVIEFFAAAQGKVRASGKRERIEWYAWDAMSGYDTPPKHATWVLVVRFDETVLGDLGALAMGRDFAEAVARW